MVGALRRWRERHWRHVAVRIDVGKESSGRLIDISVAGEE